MDPKRIIWCNWYLSVVKRSGVSREGTLLLKFGVLFIIIGKRKLHVLVTYKKIRIIWAPHFFGLDKGSDILNFYNLKSSYKPYQKYKSKIRQ